MASRAFLVAFLPTRSIFLITMLSTVFERGGWWHTMRHFLGCFIALFIIGLLLLLRLPLLPHHTKGTSLSAMLNTPHAFRSNRKFTRGFQDGGTHTPPPQDSIRFSHPHQARRLHWDLLICRVPKQPEVYRNCESPRLLKRFEKFGRWPISGSPNVLRLNCIVGIL